MNQVASGITFVPLRSTPALAAALRQMNSGAIHFAPVPLPKSQVLPPMYRLRSGTQAEEVEAAVRLVSEVAERMRRLTVAYAEWRDFDAPAYFDLPAAFSGQLVRVVERVSTVHIIFFADLLLPAFQQVTIQWEQSFLPAYQRRNHTPEIYRTFFEDAQPVMSDAWQRLLSVMTAARTQLLDDIGFFTTNGADDERMRWQALWRQPPIVELDPMLTPALSTIPTLTLALDFPLPAQRQPERIRRLRQSRERRRRRRER